MPHSSFPRRILKNPSKRTNTDESYIRPKVSYHTIILHVTSTVLHMKILKCPSIQSKIRVSSHSDSGMQWCLLLATLTIVTPVCVPGVGNQPVGGVILLSPAQDLDGMTPQHLSSHMLVHTWQHRTEKVTPWESTTCQNCECMHCLWSVCACGCVFVCACASVWICV